MLNMLKAHTKDAHIVYSGPTLKDVERYALWGGSVTRDILNIYE